MTKEGHLRPGPFSNPTTVDPCDPDVVTETPDELPWFDGSDLAKHDGHIWLYRFAIDMLYDCAPLEFFAHDTQTEADAKWHGRYLLPEDLSDDDIRTRTMKQMMLSEGILKIWWLNELVEDEFIKPEIAWTSSPGDPCAGTQSIWRDLVASFRRPILVEYEKCYELFGNWLFDFTLDQRQPEAGQMEMQIELPAMTSTGNLFVRAYDATVNTSGYPVPENWHTDPANPAPPDNNFYHPRTLVGPGRWPFADKEHLQDPDKIQIGICKQLDPVTAPNDEQFEWTIEVWQGLSHPGSDENEVWSARGEEFIYRIDGPESRRNDGSQGEVTLRGTHREDHATNLCNLHELFYQCSKPHPSTLYWSNKMLCGTTDDVDYEDEERNIPSYLSQYLRDGNMNFQIQWNGKFNVSLAGTYTFYLCANIGARLKINGRTLINFGAEKGPWEAPVDWTTDTPRKGAMNDGTDDIRNTKAYPLNPGIHDIEVIWWNTSPSYLFHFDVCPKPYLNASNAGKSNSTYAFSDECSGCSGESLPAQGAKCSSCVGWDSVFGGRTALTTFWLADRDDYLPKTPLEDPKVDADCDVSPTSEIYPCNQDLTGLP